jgi:hypothetical protein
MANNPDFFIANQDKAVIQFSEDVNFPEGFRPKISMGGSVLSPVIFPTPSEYTFNDILLNFKFLILSLEGVISLSPCNGILDVNACTDANNDYGLLNTDSFILKNESKLMTFNGSRFKGSYKVPLLLSLPTNSRSVSVKFTDTLYIRPAGLMTYNSSCCDYSNICTKSFLYLNNIHYILRVTGTNSNDNNNIIL